MSPKKKLNLLINFFKKKSFSIAGETGELLIEASKNEIEVLLGSVNEGIDFDMLFASTNLENTFRLVDGNVIFNIEIFDSKANFSNSFKSVDSSKNYLIFDISTKEFLAWIEGVQLKSENWLNDDFFYSNIFSFKKYIYSWVGIGKEANLSDNEYSFIDYYNAQKETFLLTTFTQKLQLKQPLYFPDIQRDLSGTLELFNSCFSVDSKNQFPRFIKKNLIDFVETYNLEDRLLQSYLNFERIYEKANLDFQVYLHDISIDKLKGEYEDFKRESLMPFSEITSKLTLKILSVPIAFSAILFALSKISNPVLEIGVIFSLLVSSIILNFSLKNHFSDLESIYRLFGRKIKSIREHPFFVNNPDEKKEIREVIYYIKEKLRYSQRFIWSYFLISSVLFVFVCVYFLWPVLCTVNFYAELDLKLVTSQYWVVIVLLMIFIGISSMQAISFNNNSRTLNGIRNDYFLSDF